LVGTIAFLAFAIVADSLSLPLLLPWDFSETPETHYSAIREEGDFFVFGYIEFWNIAGAEIRLYIEYYDLNKQIK